MRFLKAIFVCSEFEKSELSNTLQSEKIIFRTMISSTEALRLAQALEQAEQNAVQMPVISAQIEKMSFQDAYAVQDAWVNLKTEKGGVRVGHKIGLTSVVMQRAFGIDEPDFGVLFQDMVHESGANISVESLIEPRIEAELAFYFKKDVALDVVDINSLLACVDYIVPCLELIDFRVTASTNGTNRTVKDTISDNAANCAIVLGDKKIPLEADLAWIAATLRKNGVLEASGVSGAVLDHPINSILWLNKKYKEFGRTIKAGEMVLAGSFVSPIPVSKGDKIEVDYNQFGKIMCSF